MSNTRVACFFDSQCINYQNQIQQGEASKHKLLASARNVSACSTKPTSVKYFATSTTDQLEASGGSPVNVVDNFGRVITVSLFAGGDLIYTKNIALQ